MSVEMSVNGWVFDTPEAKKPSMWTLWTTPSSQRLNQSLVSQQVVHTWGQKTRPIHSSLPIKPKKLAKSFATTGMRKNNSSSLTAGHRTMKLHTLDDAAETLAVSKSTIVRLVRTNQLAVTRIGRAVRISDESLRRYVDSHTSHSFKAQAKK